MTYQKNKSLCIQTTNSKYIIVFQLNYIRWLWKKPKTFIIIFSERIPLQTTLVITSFYFCAYTKNCSFIPRMWWETLGECFLHWVGKYGSYLSVWHHRRNELWKQESPICWAFRFRDNAFLQPQDLLPDHLSSVVSAQQQMSPSIIAGHNSTALFWDTGCLTRAAGSFPLLHTFTETRWSQQGWPMNEQMNIRGRNKRKNTRISFLCLLFFFLTDWKLPLHSKICPKYQKICPRKLKISKCQRLDRTDKLRIFECDDKISNQSWNR